MARRPPPTDVELLGYLAEKETKSFGQMARKYNVHKSTVQNWIKRAKKLAAQADAPVSIPVSTPVSERVSNKVVELANHPGFCPANDDAPPAIGEPEKTLDTSGESPFSFDSVDVDAADVVDPFAAAMDTPANDAVEEVETAAPSMPEGASFMEKLNWPLPSEEEFAAGNVSLTNGAGYRYDVTKSPDFVTVKDMCGEFIEAAIGVQEIGGHYFKVRLPDEMRVHIARMWAIPIFRLSRALGMSGPIMEIVGAVMATKSVLSNVRDQIYQEPDKFLVECAPPGGEGEEGEEAA